MLNCKLAMLTLHRIMFASSVALCAVASWIPIPEGRAPHGPLASEPAAPSSTLFFSATADEEAAFADAKRFKKALKVLEAEVV